MAGEQWAVPCTDATGRPRVMTIRVSHGAVVLGVPARPVRLDHVGDLGLVRDQLRAHMLGDSPRRDDGQRHQESADVASNHVPPLAAELDRRYNGAAPGQPLDLPHLLVAVEADPETAQDIRMKLAVAIGTVSFPASDTTSGEPADPVTAVGGTWLDDVDGTTHGWRPDDELQRSLCGRVAHRADLSQPEDEHGRDPACSLAAALELGTELAEREAPEGDAEYLRGF